MGHIEFDGGSQEQTARRLPRGTSRGPGGDRGTSDWALRNRLGINFGFVGDDWGRLRRTARASTRAGLLLYRPRALCVVPATA